MTTYAYLRMFNDYTQKEWQSQFLACTAHLPITYKRWDDSQTFPKWRDHLFRELKNGDTLVVTDLYALGSNAYDSLYFIYDVLKAMENEGIFISIRVINDPVFNTDLGKADFLLQLLGSIVKTQDFFEKKDEIAKSIEEKPENVIPIEKGVFGKNNQKMEELCISSCRNIYFLSPEDRNKWIKEAWEYANFKEDGKRVFMQKDVAELYDISPGTLSRWLRDFSTENGIDYASFNSLCDRQQRRIINYEKETGKPIQIKATKLKDTKKKKPIYTTKEMKRKKIAQEAKNLRNEGWTYKQIGKKYGLSHTTIGNYIRNLAS